MPKENWQSRDSSSLSVNKDKKLIIHVKLKKERKNKQLNGKEENKKRFKKKKKNKENRNNKELHKLSREG